MASVRHTGYKPQTVSDLLGVGFQTLRYWRQNLEPLPKRACFSASDLLAFRIIKFLIYKKHLTVELLSHFPIETIFSVCKRVELPVLSNELLLLDESNYSLRFSPQQERVDIYNLDLHSLPIAPVAFEHQNAFLALGNISNLATG